jgi:hypothetical protein
VHPNAACEGDHRLQVMQYGGWSAGEAASRRGSSDCSLASVAASAAQSAAGAQGFQHEITSPTRATPTRAIINPATFD